MATQAKRAGSRRAGLAEFVAAIDDVNQLAKVLESTPIDAKTLRALVAHCVNAATVNRQKAAANKKHAKNQEARVFAINVWHQKRYKYKTNKEFSEAAAQAVFKKFGVSVLGSTISRDWLRGVPPSRSMASKNGALAYVDGRFIGGKS